MRARLNQLIVLVVLVALGWYGYARYGDQVRTALGYGPPPKVKLLSDSPYVCDGRVQCAQMQSCDEMRYFERHCPGMRLDSSLEHSFKNETCEQRLCK